VALNIKDAATVQLAGEVAALTGQSKTAAVRQALEERRRRLACGAGTAAERKRRLEDLLQREIWPQVPAEQLGRGVTRHEREAILGYGPEGV
jgi:antitoxin VapB